MAKLESTFKNMALSLTSITLVAAAALAGVFMMTNDAIEQQKIKAEEDAKAAVLNGDAEGTPILTEVNGFGGPIKVMVGFAKDGTILGYKILEHQETPGLGSKAEAWFQDANKPAQNIIGRNASAELIVSKDGGDVDAITAATISSRAFLGAINQAYKQFREQNGDCLVAEDAVEGCTGASQIYKDSVNIEEGKEADHE